MLKYMLIFITIFIISCSDEKDKNEPIDYNTNGIIPLKIGNYWKYESQTYFTKDSLPTYSYDNLSVFGDTNIDGTKYYFVLNINNEYTASTNKEDGYYYHSFDNIKNNDFLYYRYPCNIGDKWDMVIFSDEDLDEKYCIVKSLNKVVTVPFGTFECINYEVSEVQRYQHLTMIDIYSYYISPGVGFIKLERSSTINPFRDTALHSISYLTDAKIEK